MAFSVPADPECARLIQQIDALTSELKKRYADLINDKLGLPAVGPMSLAGHQQQFRDVQRGLRRRLNEADAKGCTGYDADAWNWATRPSASPGSGGADGP